MARDPKIEKPGALRVLKRFLLDWMTAAAPVFALGWLAGRVDVARHGYAARGMPHLAAFAAHKPLALAIVAGLNLGFWIALLFLAARALSRHPLRARRTILITFGFAALTAGGYVAKNLPAWKALADSAAYGGQPVNLMLGISLLMLMSVVQATQAQRLLWICAAGIFLTALSAPSALIEKRLFRKTPKDPPPRRRRDAVGFAALAVNVLLAASLIATSRSHAPPDSPPVIWICIDTLRADHLSLYGYPRETCPNLENLAADGIVVDQFISEAPWTLPAHATMFSGLPPGKHGVAMQSAAFSPRTPLFPEILKERGYRTGAITTSLLLSPTFGFDAGFDMYVMNIGYNADAVVDRGLAWLAKSDETPFLFLHLFDPHYPYMAPPPVIGRFGKVERAMMGMQQRSFFDFVRYVRGKPKLLQAAIDRYDEEIVYSDRALGRLFSQLKKRGLYDKAWIIVVSDHGEEFFEHDGMGHSVTMYEELTRVPLIVKAPDSKCKGTRISDSQIPQAAVADLILAAAQPEAQISGGPACDPADGALALLHKLTTHDPILGESRIFGPIRFMARTPEMKLHSPAEIDKADIKVRHGFQLFDLRADPGEKSDIFEPGRAPGLEKAVADAYAEWSTLAPPAEKRSLDPETINRLKSLGYMN